MTERPNSGQSDTPHKATGDGSGRKGGVGAALGGLCLGLFVSQIFSTLLSGIFFASWLSYLHKYGNKGTQWKGSRVVLFFVDSTGRHEDRVLTCHWYWKPFNVFKMFNIESMLAPLTSNQVMTLNTVVFRDETVQFTVSTVLRWDSSGKILQNV